MPISQLHNNQVKRIKLSEFKHEKDLQHLVEQNLQIFFNCRFVASEFSTGNVHSGRIDTLALIGDLELTITDHSDFEQAKYLIHESIRILVGDFWFL